MAVQKRELVRRVAKKTHITNKKAAEVINAATAEIIRMVAEGSDVTLSGFGTFTRCERKERKGYDIGRQEAARFPATVTPKFRASAGKGVMASVGSAIPVVNVGVAATLSVSMIAKAIKEAIDAPEPGKEMGKETGKEVMEKGK